MNNVDRRKKILILKYINIKHGPDSFIDKKNCNKIYLKTSALEKFNEEELENIFKFLSTT